MPDVPKIPPTIELDGVRLRPFRDADASALFDYLSDPVVTERTSFPPITTAFAEAMVARAQARWIAGELAKWALARSDDDVIVGTCGFNEWSPLHRWAEIAFDLAPAQWGKGVMRQASTAALAYAFTQGIVHRVHAYVRVDNDRSQQLLQRTGFVREGCLRSYRVCRGQPYDFYVYGLLHDDWLATTRS